MQADINLVEDALHDCSPQKPHTRCQEHAVRPHSRRTFHKLLVADICAWAKLVREPVLLRQTTPRWEIVL